MRGGQDRACLSLKELLESHGHTVVPFFADSQTVGREARGAQARLFMEAVYSRSQARHLSRLLDRQKIDLAHVHNLFPLLSLSVLDVLRRRQVPTVMTVHDFRWRCPSRDMFRAGTICERCGRGWFLPAVAFRCLNGSLPESILAALISYSIGFLGGLPSRVDHFLAPSEFLRGMLIQRGFPPERVTCIPHFTESVRESGYAAGPRGYLLYFGRLSAVKGVRTLVMAMRELQGVVLKIVGDGPQRAELERLAQQVRADGGIQFHGRKVGQELEELISGARAVIVPSEFYETFGLTCIESFAWGKPVIASRLGSLPEIVREGENGLLFRPGDAADLGAAVSRLLRDTPLASSMGRRNQAAVQEKYLPEAHYRRLLGIYDLVLASKRGGSAHSNTAGK